MLRVIAGRCKGLRIRTPRGLAVRPSTGKVREALFSILAAEVGGAAFLDLYAGSGAVGIEALSRGARRAVFVDEAPQACETILANLALCGLEGPEAQVIRDGARDALRELAGRGVRFDVVFADPPYDREVGPVLRLVPEVLRPDGVAVLEHDPDTEPEPVSGLAPVETRRYGGTALTFFEPTG